MSELRTMLERVGVRRVVNPTPQEGLSSSVRIGLRELEQNEDVTAAVILPGDQPRVRPEVIRRLVDASSASSAPLLIAPQYDSDQAPNPILARRKAWRLADDLVGDRGFGPLLSDRPDLVQRIRVEGANPDVDTRADLVGLQEEEWADRVRANRDQVNRVREVPDGADFYGPVTSLFRARPAWGDMARRRRRCGSICPSAGSNRPRGDRDRSVQWHARRTP